MVASGVSPWKIIEQIIQPSQSGGRKRRKELEKHFVPPSCGGWNDILN